MSVISKSKGKHFIFTINYTDEQDIYEWIDQIEQTGVKFAIFPPYYKGIVHQEINDKFQMSSEEFQCYVIVSYDRPVSIQSVLLLTNDINSTPPRKVENIIETYNRLTYEYDIQKHLCKSEPTRYNGWELPVKEKKKEDILQEIRETIIAHDIESYTVLTMYCDEMGPEHFKAVKDHVMLFSKLCESNSRIKNRADD